MLDKLTSKQEKLLIKVREEWLDKLFKSKLSFNEAKARKGVEWLYSFSGLKEPMILFVDSPMGAQIAVKYAKTYLKLLKEKGVDMKIKGAQVWDQVRAQVWAQVGAQVGAQVWAQVRAQVWEYESFSSYGNIWDWGWNAFYDFFERIGIDLGKRKDDLYKFRELLNSGIYDMIQLDGLCVVCKLPQKISRDGIRLHSTEGYAIEWADGYGQNYLWGIYFKEDLFKQIISKKLSFKKVMEIENMEQRMVALKYYGAELLLKKSKAKLLDKSKRGNSLYLIKGIFSRDAYFLKYSCPSTDRVYVSGIDPEIGKKGSADEAMAWKHHFTIEEYSRLKVEA